MAQAVSPFRVSFALGYVGFKLLIGQGLRRQRTVFFLQVGAIALSSGAALLILILSYSFRTTIAERLYGYFGGLWIKYYAEAQETAPKPIEKVYVEGLLYRTEPAIHLPMLIEGRGTAYAGVDVVAVEASWWKNPLWQQALIQPIHEWTGENGVVLSRRLAQRLGIRIGDEVILVWLADPPRLRRLPVLSLYDAKIDEIDRQIVFVPLPLAQVLLGWDSTQIQIAHLFFSDPTQQTSIAEAIVERLPHFYEILPIEQIFPDIFGWLGLIEQNVQVILGIVLGLSIFAVASGFLVLQFSQRLRYEILWSLGAQPIHLRMIALYQAIFSVLLGTVIGIGWSSLLLWTQWQWEWFRLDPENYLLPAVPVQWYLSAYGYVMGTSIVIGGLISVLAYPRRRALRLLTQAE